jgi:Glyoxalase/Bleomycin resistance protein/Dioxygenase superfamily
MKKTFFLLWFALPLLADAQSARAVKATSEPPFTVRGAFFALSVADLESSARWYSEKFGLKVVMQAPKTKTVRSAVIVLAGGGLLVELIQTDEAMPLSKAASGELPSQDSSLTILTRRWRCFGRGTCRF